MVTDQQLGGLADIAHHRPRHGFALRHHPATIDNTLYDAFGQRQINTLYTQLNQYHVILETDPKFQLNREKLHDIYIQSAPAGSATAAAASNTAGSSSGAGAGAASAPEMRC